MPSNLVWRDGVPNLIDLDAWLSLTRKARTLASRRQSIANQHSRRSALRQGNVKHWLRSLRGAFHPAREYAPTWVRLENGEQRRPTTPQEALLGTSQEWSRLFQEPSQAWSSPFIRRWRDPAGYLRGSVNPSAALESPAGSLERRIVDATMKPGALIIWWNAEEVVVHSHLSVSVASWNLTSAVTGWYACRQLPVRGPERKVLSVNGHLPETWTADRWFHTRVSRSHGYIVIHSGTVEWKGLCSPLSAEEKAAMIRKSRNSRPGRSSWKLFFLPLLPSWAQQAYWDLLDAQRLLAIVSDRAKVVVQVNIPKPSTGFRPIGLLEESLKGIEGPVARRRVNSRSPSALGDVYSSANVAGERGRQAAIEVLYLDVLVCEDASHFRLPFCRIPTDYERFFNVIQLPVVDTVDECRGLSDTARRLPYEALFRAQVFIETKWGEAPGISVTRGLPQGSVSGPELSHRAQAPILRIRASSRAQYVISAGRLVPCAGYVDDTEHYGSGAAHLPLILQELGLTSEVTGIGFSWQKFSAYASDWDEFVSSPEAAICGLSVRGITSRGWDIWRGGSVQGIITRLMQTMLKNSLENVAPYQTSTPLLGKMS